MGVVVELVDENPKLSNPFLVPSLRHWPILVPFSGQSFSNASLNTILISFF
jgi:hypothetical protein